MRPPRTHSRTLPHLALASLLLAHLLSNAASQSLASQLILNFLPANAAARAATPQDLFNAETPIVVRYTLIGGIALYEPQAACHPTALSFFAVRDPIPSIFCTDEDNLAILQSYTLHRALRDEFPADMNTYANFLRSRGLEPESNSTDRTTLNGWANFAGARLATFFATDGWNSLGTENGGPFRIPFEDTTSYSPINRAELNTRRLQRPLRWQPLVVQLDNGRGRFGAQVHVVPHIGLRGTPLLLSPAEFQATRVRSPFRTPGKARPITARDGRVARSLLRGVIRESQLLTPQRILLARWWDNKLLSTAALSSFYNTATGLTGFEVAQQFMGEMMAQHDALLLAWKEKRRHDLARPRTLMRQLLRGQTFRAFIDEQRGFGTVAGENWQPLLQEQPHSEFPSASAALCTAALDHIGLYARRKVGPKGVIPRVNIRYPAGSLPFQPGPAQVRFSGPAEAARVCGQSRLWAGVHFRPAVKAGRQLGAGLGQKAFDHILELEAGRIPERCPRC